MNAFTVSDLLRASLRGVEFKKAYFDDGERLSWSTDKTIVGWATVDGVRVAIMKRWGLSIESQEWYFGR